MRHEIKKISRIVDELTTLFLKEDTNEVDFSIKRQPDRTVIKIVDYRTHFEDDFIEQLRELFNTQRQCEVEEYYWQLCGEVDEDEELTLIGCMIDEATVEKREGNLYLELVRYHQ
ncbi:MAG: hypothetical protein JXO44_03630 [Clostridia bacterium]|nr:hypothetical protein [Clostridia bacterium]